MGLRVKKIRRPRDDGELVIEQTRDRTRVATILAATGIPAVGLERPGHCYLIANVGGRLVGVAAVETRIDVAVLGALAVVPAMRRCGIGAALLAAARRAAHTRGARELYAVAPPEAGVFFQRNGFAPVATTPAIAALAGTFVADQLRTSPLAITEWTAWLLDISRDGIVIR